VADIQIYYRDVESLEAGLGGDPSLKVLRAFRLSISMGVVVEDHGVQARPTAIPHPGTWYGSGPGMFREHRDVPVWCSWPEQDLSAIHYTHGTGDAELAVTVS
jgi:hypothetical protein